MSSLNDIKLAELFTVTGKTAGSVNDMEMDWLSRVRLRAGNTLQELWTDEFISVTSNAKVLLGYADNQHAYLDFLGAAGETLGEKWMDLYSTGLPV